MMREEGKNAVIMGCARFLSSVWRSEEKFLPVYVHSHLIRCKQVMRPGVTILERLVVAAPVQAHHESFRRLHPLLSQTVMDFLDSLLALEPDSGQTTLYTLRQHATTNTPAALVRALDKRA